MKMKSTVLFGVLAVSSFGLRADINWDVNGTGGWFSESQWVEKRTPVDGDTIRFPAKSYVEIDDALAAQLPNASYVPAAGAALVFDLSADHPLRGGLYGNGTVIKLGSGQLDITNTISYAGTLAVSNGALRVGKWNERISDRTWPIVDVGPNGTFKIGAPTTATTTIYYLQGLRGEGVVAKENSVSDFRLNFLGARDTDVSPEYEFKGTLSGTSFSTSLGMSGSSSTTTVYGKPCFQYYTNPDVVTPMPVRLYYGTFGYSTLGTDSQTINAFGAMPVAPAESVLRYLGTGGKSVHKVGLYNSCREMVFVLDGGPHGGLEWNGTISNNANSDGAKSGVVMRMAVDGVAGTTNTLSAMIKEDKAEQAIAVTKRGAGTWRFSHASTQNKGPLTVAQGTLEFNSIAPAGTACSLGTSSFLSTNYTGVAESCAVPWAYRLGDGRTDDALADLATFAYAGSATAVCTNRPVAVDGAARVTAVGTGSIDFADAFSYGPGINTLVLSGSGENRYSSLTNGVGALRVVKEGSGTWILERPTELGGGAYAKEGRLFLRAAYTWFRFIVRQNWGVVLLNPPPENGTIMTGFGLWDASGMALDTNLVHNTACDAATARLAPGEFAMTLPNSGAGRYEWGKDDRSCAKLFHYEPNEDQDVYSDITQFRRYVGSSKYSVPRLDDEKTWIGFVLRLPAVAKPAVKYDIRSYWEKTANVTNFSLEPMAWSLEGSTDGVNWHDLHIVSSNETPVTVRYNWYASNTVHHTGYPIASHVTGACSLASVGAAEGATVETDEETEVGCLECDAVLGCGTLKGFAFAETGTLAVRGCDTLSGGAKFAYDLSSCTGLENLANWTVVLNGKEKPAYKVSATPSGVTVTPPGVLILVR